MVEKVRKMKIFNNKSYKNIKDKIGKIRKKEIREDKIIHRWRKICG